MFSMSSWPLVQNESSDRVALAARWFMNSMASVDWMKSRYLDPT